MNCSSPFSYKCAILLAAYNGVSFIEEQIESVDNQVNVKAMIFISVDLSQDETYQWCRQLESERNNIVVLPYGEKFGGAAKNFFRLFRDVDFSQFDYIALSDQDDIWYPDKISRAIENIKSKNVDAYSGNVVAFWADGRRRLIDKAQPQRKLDYFFEAAGPGCTYVMNQKLAADFQDFLRKTPATNNVILHDWLLYAFARSQGYSWFIDSVPCLDYRQHENNQVGVNTTFSSFFKRAKYVFFDGVAQVNQLIDILPSNAEFKKYNLSYRRDVFCLLLQGNELRRKPIERFYVVMVLLITLILGVRKT